MIVPVSISNKVPYVDGEAKNIVAAPLSCVVFVYYYDSILLSEKQENVSTRKQKACRTLVTRVDSQIKVSLGRALGTNSPPDCCGLDGSNLAVTIKNTDTRLGIRIFW